MHGWLTRLALGPGAATAMLALTLGGATAQPREIVIGVLYPLSGGVAQAGVDSKAAVELAGETVNGKHDLDMPLARTEGLPNLGGARVRFIFVDHQGKPEIGQAEAERLITQEKAVALCGAYHTSVSATAARSASDTASRTSPASRCRRRCPVPVHGSTKHSRSG